MLILHRPHIGQLQFYIALTEDKLRRQGHATTVGISICSSRKDHTVRYALNKAGSPMAVSTYTYQTLPAREQATLPSENDLATSLDLARNPTPQD